MLKLKVTFSFLFVLLGLSACDADLSGYSANTTAFEPSVAFAKAEEGEAELDVCPISEQRPDKVRIDNEPDTPYVDYNRDVKDFGTSFVVNEFFKSKDTLFNFMKLVYGTIDSAINKYRERNDLEKKAIFFIFKGGNVLRIVANQVFSMISPEARNLLEAKYKDYIKRSDADFSVFIDESKLRNLDYNDVMNDMLELAYESLGKIRNEFTKHPQKYFNFFQLDTKDANAVLNEYFEQLKKIDAISDEENDNWYQAKFAQFQLLDEKAKDALSCGYEGQYDYRYEFDHENNEKIIGIPLTTQTSWIMNSINRTLSWPVENNPKHIIKFYLVRAKIQFEYTYLKDGEAHRKPIGGELIDISFPHRDDFRLKEFFGHYDDWLANYDLTLKDTGETLTMKAESINGLADDLSVVLFEQFSRPWDGAKYEKRINRLFFLSITDMLGTYGLGSKVAKHYVNKVVEKIATPLKDLLPLHAGSKGVANDVLTNAKTLAQQYPEMATANMLFENIGNVALELVKNPAEKDDKEFNEFLTIITDNLDVMSQLTDMKPHKINFEDIYHVDMSSFF